MRVSAQVSNLCNPVGVMSTEILPTRVEEFIKQMMPWAHGHQIKAITKFVLAIIEKQTGCQAELARLFAKRAQGPDEAIRTSRHQERFQADLSIRQARPHSALG